MKKVLEDVRKELVDHVLPFWLSLEDVEYGGFYGNVSFDLEVNKKGNKGAIALARYLWSFSSAYRILKEESYLKAAEHAYQFLIQALLDKELGGVYWLLDYKGRPIDDRKHVYAQSFAIYGLSEYYRATGTQEALEHAKQLFHLIENNGFDNNNQAYMEEFTRNWVVRDNEMLSENGIMATITMNTHLHVLEAYTNLYRVWPDDFLKQKIKHLIRLFDEKILNAEAGYYKVFFDEKWKEIIKLKSFGHDIEATWLIDEAIKVTGEGQEMLQKLVVEVAYNILNEAMDTDGGIHNELEDGKLHPEKIWWGQAEAMVGFLNAYEHTKDERFVEAIQKLWSYINTSFVDKRPNGEWFWGVNHNGTPMKRDIAESWKAPYHVSRFCLEYIERN